MKPRYSLFSALLFTLIISLACVSPHEERPSQPTSTSQSLENTKIQLISNFKAPFGADMDRNGNLYISDFDAQKVVKVSPDFQTIQNFAQGEQTFVNPHTIFVDDESSSLVLTDFGKRSVEIFGLDGKFLFKLNYNFVGPVQARYLPGFKDRFVVTDYLGKAVVILGKEGTIYGAFAATDSPLRKNLPSELTTIVSQFDRPKSAALDSQGNFYIVEHTSCRVIRFGPDLKEKGWIGLRQGQSNFKNGWQTGASACGTSPGAMDSPLSIFNDQDRFLYVVDLWNSRIQRYKLNGEFAGWLGLAKYSEGRTLSWQMTGTPLPGCIAGAFNRPYDFRIRNGKYIITDTHNSRVQVMDQIDQ